MLDEGSQPLLLNPAPAKKRTSVVILVAVLFGVVVVFNIPTRNTPSPIQANFKSASHTCQDLGYHRCATNDGLTLDEPAEKYFRGFPVAADATIEEYGNPKTVVPVMMASLVDSDSPHLCLPHALNSELGMHSSLVYTDKTVIVVDDGCVIHRIIEKQGEDVSSASDNGNGNVIATADLTLTASVIGVDVVGVTYSGAQGDGSEVVGLYPPRSSWLASWHSYTPFWRTVPSASGTIHFGWIARGVPWVAVFYKAADWQKAPLRVSNAVTLTATTSAPLPYPKGYFESFRSSPSSNNVHFYATTIAIDPTGGFMVVGAYDIGQVSVVRCFPAINSCVKKHVVLISAPFANGPARRFGYSVATNGKYIVVGAPSYEDNGVKDSGVICVFESVNTTQWVFRKLLKSPLPRQYGELGINVAIDVQNTVVGGEWNQGHIGKAYAWRGISAAASEVARPLAQAEEGSFYGRKVAVRFPIAVVSSERKSYFDIFKFEATSNKFGWQKRVTREAPCCFGSTLTMSGDGSAIAAGNYRTVYIFRGNVNHVFTEEFKIMRTEAIGSSHFALDHKGHRIAMGYTGDSSRPNGKVFIYDRNEQKEWSMKFQPLSEPPRHFYDYFGLHLAMSGDGTKLVVAAPRIKSAIMFVTHIAHPTRSPV